jgi:hypothetical protein
MPKGYPKDGKPRKLSPLNRCAVCRHPDRPRIEALHCAGVTLDRLAEKFELRRDAIWRHMGRHVTDERKAGYLIGPAKIAELADIAAEESQSVLDYYGILRSALFFQLDKLAAKNDAAGVAMLAGRLTDVLGAIAKVTGQVSTFANSTIINVQNNVQILNSPPFADLQAGLLRVCVAHPDARRDIIALFKDLDAKYGATPATPAPAMLTARGSANG